jgi:hypothetical protein
LNRECRPGQPIFYPFCLPVLGVGNLRRDPSWANPNSNRLLGIRTHAISHHTTIRPAQFNCRLSSEREKLMLKFYSSRCCLFSSVVSWGITGSSTEMRFSAGSPGRLEIDRHDAVSLSALDPACLGLFPPPANLNLPAQT